MKNNEVAELLYKIADLLEIQGVNWKPQAYRTAARNIEILNESIDEVYKQGRLLDVKGVGENIAEKIEEELKYPWEIKVVVIRVNRVIEYAR